MNDCFVARRSPARARYCPPQVLDHVDLAYRLPQTNNCPRFHNIGLSVNAGMRGRHGGGYPRLMQLWLEKTTGAERVDGTLGTWLVMWDQGINHWKHGRLILGDVIESGDSRPVNATMSVIDTHRACRPLFPNTRLLKLPTSI